MLHVPNIKLNRRLGMFAFLGFLSSIGISALQSVPTYATCSDDLTPCVEVTFGAPQGNLSVNPSLSYYDSTKFYLPVEIGLKNASIYTVKVYGNGSDLVSGNESIPTIGTDTSYTDLGKSGSEWGIRWNLGDTVEDKDTNYHKVPASAEDNEAIVVENKYLPKSSTIIKKQLTLGFAVAVGPDQPSGSYTNTITVAVVASPRDARSIFDISTMQEMSPEICENTTTPNAMAISTSANINVTSSGASYTTAIDTNGDHPDDGNYVPQTELTDTRDGKKYTIRKLADGNCWMVSSLEFDLVSTPGAYSTNGTDKLTGSDLILTSEDTDLNSMSTWTPAIAAATYGTAGTVYKTQKSSGIAWAESGSDGLRSFSSAAAYPTALYSTKNFSSNTLTFGTASSGSPWQKFGNLYNWVAATLGSSANTSEEQNPEDSVCPRGWKIPANMGDGSFSSLLGTYGLPTAGETNVSTKINKAINFPLNFLRTGVYDYTKGNVQERTLISNYWIILPNSPGRASRFASNDLNIYPYASTYYGYGFAIRCVARK